MQDADSWKVTNEELRNKVSLMEKMLEEAKSRETALREETTEWEEKHDIISKETLKLRDEIERIQNDAERVNSFKFIIIIKGADMNRLGSFE